MTKIFSVLTLCSQPWINKPSSVPCEQRCNITCGRMTLHDVFTFCSAGSNGRTDGEAKILFTPTFIFLL